VTPFGYQGGLYAWCVDSNGNFVPNCTPSIINGYYVGTGGHGHDDPGHPFGAITDNGQPNGNSITYQIAFSATRVGQLEWIDACADTCFTTDVYVWFQGFGELGATGNLALVGMTNTHPINHFGEVGTIAAVNNIANQYAANYSGAAGYQVVGVNDIALPGGGVFDLNSNWNSPHIRHDYGRAVDFRANANPNSVLPEAYDTFVQYCRDAGLSSLAFLEQPGTANQHIHCDGN